MTTIANNAQTMIWAFLQFPEGRVEVVRLVGVLTKGPFYRFYRWWKLRDVQAVGPGGPGTVATKSSRTEAVMSRCIRPANIRPDRW